MSKEKHGDLAFLLGGPGSGSPADVNFDGLMFRKIWIKVKKIKQDQ